MNTLHKTLKRTLLVTTLSVGTLVSLPVLAEDGSAHHSGQASKHSALALSHGVSSTSKVASAVVAVPIIVVGGVSVAAGSTVMALGDSIVSSNQSVSVKPHIHAPLEISDIVITADPAPNQLNANQDQQETLTTIITTTEALKKTTIEKKQR